MIDLGEDEEKFEQFMIPLTSKFKIIFIYFFIFNNNYNLLQILLMLWLIY